MKINKVFLLLTLTLLFLGIAYATETTDDTVITEETVASEVQPTSTTQDIVEDNIISKEPTEDNEIRKTTENKSVKTASNTIDVNDFNTLHNTLTSDTYDTVTLNIKKDIKLTDDTVLNGAIKKLTINGNGKTIDGDNNHQFLKINPYSTVTIKNIKIINCEAYRGGVIDNGGSLTMGNCTLYYNTADYGGGAIYNSGSLIIGNCTLYYNIARDYSGGAIYNGGSLSMGNCTLYYNTADYGGGAIYNGGSLTMGNCTLNNNKAYNYDGGAIYNNYGNLTIGNSTLNNNTAYYGGAIYNYYGNLTIGNSTLYYNTADNGGAISNYYGNLTIGNCTLNNNTADYGGGAIYNSGSLIIGNCTLYYNSAYNGGAIYNGGNLTIGNCTLYYNSAYEGGAIYNGGSLTIGNCTLYYNTADEDGGAIYNGFGSLTMGNCTLYYNTADYSGGAIYNKGNLATCNCTLYYNSAYYGGAISNDYGSLTMGNCTLYYNTADYGGAIYNVYGSLTMGNCTLNYNTAHDEGGAIYNYYGNLTIGNSTLNYNTADYSGGAIYNWGNLTIGNCTLNNNTAEYDYGGAIYNRGNLIIGNSTLNYNTADKYGGAIYNYYSNLNIGNSTLYYNTADNDGGAIYHFYGSLIINSNTFHKNEAKNTLNDDIIVNKGFSTLYNNVNIQYIYNSTIYTETDDSEITNNIFDGRNPTELYMYTIYNTNKGKTIKVSGKLLSNGSPVTGQNIDITVNTKKFSVISDRNGYFTVNYTVNSYNNGIVTFKYNGNEYYSPTTNSTTFVVKKPVELYMYTIYNTNKGKTIKVSGKVLSSNSPVQGLTVNIMVNNKNYSATSDKNGYFTVNYTVDSYNNGTVKFRFPGNSMYESCTNTTTFVVKQPVELYMYTIYNTNKGKTIKVSGKLLSSGNPLKGLTVNVTVNNKNYSVTSDKNGYFTVNYTVDSYNNGTVKFRFAGNSMYESCTNTTTFTVKQPVELYMYTIYNTNKGKTIKVSGKVLSSNSPVQGLTVSITVNGKNYSAVSDRNGYFTVNHTVDSYNNGTVKFRFAGNSMYESCTNTTTFTVKQPVELYMYTIYNTNKGKTIKVSGKVLSSNSPVQGLTVSITVNGKNYSAVSDKNGYFTINYTVDSYNNGSVKFRFAGNSMYESCTNTTTFVVKQPVSIYMYPRTSEPYGKTIKVSGKLLCNDTGVKGQTVKITINGQEFTATTGGYGYFTINYTIDTYDKHNVVYRFAGSSMYESCTNSTVFTIKP